MKKLNYLFPSSTRGSSRFVGNISGYQLRKNSPNKEIEKQNNLLFLHGAGFCKEIWNPIVGKAFQSKKINEIHSLDLQNHGNSQAFDGKLNSSSHLNWWNMAHDVLEWEKHIYNNDENDDEGNLIGVGHSTGGAVLMMTAILNPNLFSKLILIEPILYPPPNFRDYEIILSKMAKKRREKFNSYMESYENFKSKPPFKDFDDQCLISYINHGFTKTVEGGMGGGMDDTDNEITVDEFQENSNMAKILNFHKLEDDQLKEEPIRLKCLPENESELYISGRDHDLWEKLKLLKVNVNIFVGEKSFYHEYHFFKSYEKILKENNVLGNYYLKQDGTHFYPFEKPMEFVDHIEEII